MRVRTIRLVELMLAPVHAEAALTDRRRLWEILAMTEQPLDGAADRGTVGPANLSRPRGIATIEDDVWYEQGGRRRYTRMDVMQYRDGVLDHYAEAGVLRGAELDAAHELTRLYRAARSTMVVPGQALCRYGAVEGRRSGESQEQYEARVWAEFNRAVDHLPRGSEAACVDLARGLFPTGHDATYHMQRGFESLAKLWRLA